MEGKSAGRLFSNHKEILANSEKSERRLREDALAILASAVKSVDPYGLVCNRVRVEGRKLKVSGENATADVELRGKVRVVAFGKASLAMARAIEEILSVDGGIVVIPRGQRGSHPKNFEILEASHPVPDESSVHAAEKALEIARNCEKNDIFIALISGGGSSLLAKPAEGLTLEDKKEVTELLLRSGCTVSELNVVRKKISAVKGGKLADAAMPAKTLALILSDVIGDPVDAIASGPTAEDTSTFSDAKEVLEKYGLWARVPESVRNFIERGLAEEELRRHEKRNAQNIIIGNNLVAARAAEEEARARGYNTLLLTTHLEGESREVARVFVAIARDIRRYGIPIETPAAVIAGGETTVTVTGDGKGGRNQEFVLSAAVRMDGMSKTVIASIGTDGIDGMSEAAGAIADGFTVKRAKELGIDPEKFLQKNDSNSFFTALNDALLTGRTGTNVNDIMIMLVDTESDNDQSDRSDNAGSDKDNAKSDKTE
ncbi:MAG: glycerate kinase [Canidatus Methanoxibalbensis ujae]|nr:glycerate kinase [Candidatus Methanoxibalbensis ujae]